MGAALNNLEAMSVRSSVLLKRQRHLFQRAVKSFLTRQTRAA
jgi:hypothetical protein